MPSVKVIVHNEKESRVVEELINQINGGQVNNICKNYGVYDTYPRFVFGNNEYINTFTLENFNKIDNPLMTIDQLRAMWMKDPKSGFTDLRKYHKDYDYSRLYRFQVKWYHRHTNIFGTEVCNIEERCIDIEAHDAIEALQIWRDSYANANAGNVVSCINSGMIESLEDYDDEP